MNNYVLHNEQQNLVSTITFTNKFAMWPAEGAPLTGALVGSALDAYPNLSINGISYIARRKLLTNNFVFNHYDVWLDKNGEKTIQIRLEPPKWKSLISYDGQEYILERKGFFFYRYILSDRTGKEIASFKETTPFLRCSIRKDFGIETAQPIDDILLTFAFWIGVETIYR